MSSANPDPIRRGMQRAIRPMSYPTAIRAICRNRAVRYGARHRMCVALAIVQHPLFELSVIRYGLFRLVRIRRELRWRWGLAESGGVAGRVARHAPDTFRRQSAGVCGPGPLRDGAHLRVGHDLLVTAGNPQKARVPAVTFNYGVLLDINSLPGRHATAGE